LRSLVVILALVLFAAPRARAQTAVWQDRSMPARPTATNCTALVYDTARDKVVAVKATNRTDTFELWELDPASGVWTLRPQHDPRPTTREEIAVAYDEGTSRLVLFGGMDTSNEDQQDTWEWDAGTGDWTLRSPASKPPARESHAMVYDRRARRVVLFGGYTIAPPAGPLRDTWEWNGTAGEWKERTPTVRPYMRRAHALAYDDDRQRVVMMGGESTQDLWEWDGAAGTWTSYPMTGTWPSLRYFLAMAYDRSRKRMVIFGGRNSDYSAISESWEWDGAAGTWQQWMGSPHPVGHLRHGLVYDRARARVIMHGGWDLTHPVSDTWDYFAAGGVTPDAGVPDAQAAPPDTGAPDLPSQPTDSGGPDVAIGGPDGFLVDAVVQPPAPDVSGRADGTGPPPDTGGQGGDTLVVPGADARSGNAATPDGRAGAEAGPRLGPDEGNDGALAADSSAAGSGDGGVISGPLGGRKRRGFYEGTACAAAGPDAPPGLVWPALALIWAGVRARRRRR
jgi:uncharacterized protein (TIGR03382 family)